MDDLGVPLFSETPTYTDIYHTEMKDTLKSSPAQVLVLHTLILFASQEITWSHHNRLTGPPCFQRHASNGGWLTRTNLDLCQGNPELLVISGGKKWDILRKTNSN